MNTLSPLIDIPESSPVLAKTPPTDVNPTSSPDLSGCANMPKPSYVGAISGLLPRRVVALDVETTGVIAEYDYVLELGATVMEDGEVIGEPFQMKVQPGDKAKISIGALAANVGEITQESLTNIAGILTNLVEGTRPLEATRAFVEWCQRVNAHELPMVAWNAEFDLSFYSRKVLSYTSAWKVPPLSPVTICVMRLLQHVNADKGHASLDAALIAYGLPPRPTTKGHTALQDAIKCGQIYDCIRRGITYRDWKVLVTKE